MVDIFIKVSPRKLTRGKRIRQINKEIFSMSEYICYLLGRRSLMGKNCVGGLEYNVRPQVSGGTQDLGHSFSLMD